MLLFDQKIDNQPIIMRDLRVILIVFWTILVQIANIKLMLYGTPKVHSFGGLNN